MGIIDNSYSFKFQSDSINTGVESAAAVAVAVAFKFQSDSINT